MQCGRDLYDFADDDRESFDDDHTADIHDLHGVGAGLLVDVNLENLLSSTLGADFKAGTTVSEFSPAGSGSPLVEAEDVVGQVASIDTVHNTFSFAAMSLPAPVCPR